MIMVSIIDNINRNMSDRATLPDQPHNIFVIAAILEFLVAITAQPQINHFLEKQSLVVGHVLSVSNNLRVEHRLLATENFPSFAVDEYHVPKERVPIGMLFERNRNLSQRARE